MSELRAAAERATPDLPWHEGTAGACNVVAYGGDDIIGVAYVGNAARRAYIAAADPTTILALLDERDRLHAALREARVYIAEDATAWNQSAPAMLRRIDAALSDSRRNSDG